MVYVLNQNSQPLMPTERYGKVRRLLKEKKAVVVSKTPFTIRLTYISTEYVHGLTLGVDAGSKNIGISVSSEEKEYYASEVILRSDIVNLLSTRRQNRKKRRNRLRYRKARFLNRVSSKNKGWLAPSIEHKIQTHLKVIEKTLKLLPVRRIVVETASFDIQKIKNPNISDAQYQQGAQLDFWNVREYVFFRDGHTCQHCKGKSKDKILNVHHIESRKIGGDSPNNLITLCETCHKAHHKGKITVKVKRGQRFRDAAFMGIMRWTFYNRLREKYEPLDVTNTYGYITKNTRISEGLEKTHAIDALCISGHPKANQLEHFYLQKKIRCHNRQIHKANLLKGGKKKLNQAQYLVKGFRLFDKVHYKRQEGFITGRRTTGYFAIKDISGVKIHDSAKWKDLELLEAKKSYIIQTKGRRFLPPL